ncbi:alkaline phosphatase D family protein [soil metagenome]
MPVTDTPRPSGSASADRDRTEGTADPVGRLVVGPLLRHADETSVCVWVEVSRPGTVTVRAGEHDASAATFSVHGHHYALVDVEGLPPGSHLPYDVHLDETRVWPPARSQFPASALRTMDYSQPLRIIFGSCRNSVPHDRRTNRRFGIDVLRALALRLADGGVPEPIGTPMQAASGWPSMLLFLGDQVYADETSDSMREYIAHHRDLTEPPGEELADFGEYAHLYRLAWSEPTVRWILSTVPSAMIFDDHDVRDDWNTSQAWRQMMHSKPWWKGRIVGGLASYWVYQHLGNLTPAERAKDPVWQQVLAADGADVGPVLDEFAAEADDDPEAYRWSFRRDLGTTRLVAVDSRAARVLTETDRAMIDAVELAWLDEQLTGGPDQLLLATSIPFLLPMGLHNGEAWNEAVASGAWGSRAADWAEQMRQFFDLEHWAAFQSSFREVQQMVAEVAAGERGPAPATVTFLSGDVHHSYLFEADLPTGPGRSRVIQAVCSPIRNPLPQVVRFVTATMAYGVAGVVGRMLARTARVANPPWTWSLLDGPWFDNSLATVDVDGRSATIAWETAAEGSNDDHLLWCPVSRARLS